MELVPDASGTALTQVSLPKHVLASGLLLLHGQSPGGLARVKLSLRQRLDGESGQGILRVVGSVG